MNIIDCDVHQTWADPKELTKRLPVYFREDHFKIPQLDLPSPLGVLRSDAKGSKGETPGSTYEKMKEQHLDAFGITKAVLTGSGILGLGIHPHFDYGNALAAAYNDALIETWLTYDDRLFGALIINPQDPGAAAKEIRRVGNHPRIVEVLMCSGSSQPFGRKFFWPIYEAAQELGLPVAVHPGTECRGTAGRFVSGQPSTYLEWHTNLPQSYMGQIVSLVCEGVFEKFPGLKFVAVEGGLAWIPGVLWRLDKNWKALRSTVPWVRRLPSEYIVEHVRFTSQPIEEPEDSKQLLHLFEMIQAEKTLMFSSDYPHWDNDSPRHSFPRLPEEMAHRIFHGNAEELYGKKFQAADALATA